MTRHGHYECDQCAACCCHFQVAATDDDIQRDRRIALYVLATGSPILNLPWASNAERVTPCAMLDNNGQCKVQASKPDVCRRFPPGGELCQWARGRAGLAPLYPK